MTDTGWRIQLLGGFCASRGERRITRFRSQKMGVLLAYLAYYLQRAHPRSALIELLWPGSDPELGRHNLNVALSRLREQLAPPDGAGESVLLSDRLSVRLDLGLVSTDVAEFENALEAAARAPTQADRIRHLTGAVEQYHGRLLPGFYEEWIAREQQRLDERCFQALRGLITFHEAAGDLDRALHYARRAVSADPLREEAHREVMRLYAAAGDPSAALRQFRELERILKQELDASPGAATRSLLTSLERVVLPTAAQGADPGSGAPEVRSRPMNGAVPLSLSCAASPGSPGAAPADLEPPGGAVPLGSLFYVARGAEEPFAAAIARRDSIVLVKGPRQVGKTSLLARGLQRARQSGARVVLTDLDSFNASQMASAESLLLALAQSLADQLDLGSSPADLWDAGRGPNANFQRFLRRSVLGAVDVPLVWGLDGVDRLFHFDFGTEIFALFRAWHNERALDPSSPWTRLTLAIAYATEAHLFITDLNRSPFNVGTRLTLDDFTSEQVADLNARYGAPLKEESELARFYALVGGHPYLVRRGLDEMTARQTLLAALEHSAASDTGVFSDHLHRMLDMVAQDPELCEVVRTLLAGPARVPPRSFYRLRSAGVLAGDAEDNARLRCRLYATYLERHLL